MARVLVCGGRDYFDRDKVYEILSEIYTECIIDVIISGHAKGADSLGEEYAKYFNIPVEIYPANWKRYGKSAGYKRNQQMLDEGKPDLVVAFPGGTGTDMMCYIAERGGVNVIKIE